jgi:AcrR family transcriptional regulator
MDIQGTATTSKGLRTRERIFETALGLFVEQGYEQTTLRDIARAADCSLGLTYRYFASKEDLVLTLYERLAAELDAQVRELPPAPLAERFDYAMTAKLARLEPYREAFGALFGAALNPRSGVAVLGGGTSEVRRSVAGIFFSVVKGATDAPREPQAQQLASVLYSLHLALILFWLYDPTPGRRATFQLLALTRDMLGLARRVLKLPPASKALERLAAAIEPVFGAGT